MTKFILSQLMVQERIAADVMRRYREYAESIGCITYDGAMWDEIECNEQQSAMLAQWWAANTGEEKCDRP